LNKGGVLRAQEAIPPTDYGAFRGDVAVIANNDLRKSRSAKIGEIAAPFARHFQQLFF
jgi:hypothetical protein